MTDWMAQAACRGMDPNIFHPVDSNGAKPSTYKLRLLDAMFVCLACPVAHQCDQYATHSGIKDGVWAGRDRHNHRHRYQLAVVAHSVTRNQSSRASTP